MRLQGFYSNLTVGDASVHVLRVKRKWEQWEIEEQWEMEDDNISSKNSQMLFQIQELLTFVGKRVVVRQNLFDIITSDSHLTQF